MRFGALTARNRRRCDAMLLFDYCIESPRLFDERHGKTATVSTDTQKILVDDFSDSRLGPDLVGVG